MIRVAKRTPGAKKTTITPNRRKASQRPAGKPRPASTTAPRRPKPKSTAAATPLPAGLFDALRDLAHRFGTRRFKVDAALGTPDAERNIAILTVMQVLYQLIRMLESWSSPAGKVLRQEASRFGGFTSLQAAPAADAQPADGCPVTPGIPATRKPTDEPSEHPPRVFLDETIAFFDRWNARDWADEPGERRAADLIFVLLSLAAKVARNIGSTDWLRFVETEADKLYTSARAIERGEASPPPAPPAAVPPTAQHRPAPPGATPRPASPTQRLLGIMHHHDSRTLHTASTAELLSWSYCGDPASDPIDGMLGSLDDDLNILRAAVESRDGALEDDEICMQLHRLETRAEVARLIYQRTMNAIDSGKLAAAPTAEKGARS